MSDVNRVVLTGRLTSDPDLRYTQSGKPVLRFDIAVNRRWVNPETGQLEEEVTFVPVVVWGRQAETCATYLRKGRQVAVDGRLRVRSFETQNGDRRRVTEVVAQHVLFLGPKPEAAEPGAPAAEETYPEEEVPF